jgi:uncharacterized membrane protein
MNHSHTHTVVDVPRAVTKAARLDSVDLLRGIIMVVMALDHVRDFFSIVDFDPLDFNRTNPLLFLTRWITHYCAPNFIFLAGTGAFLGTTRGKSKPELSRFLWTRGLWLILLDMTVIRFSWAFNWDFTFNFMMILWPIGFAMILLAALVYVPAHIVGIMGVAIIALHNLSGRIQPETLGAFSGLWKLMLSTGAIQLGPNIKFIAFYPLLPWLGVMAAGYGFGTLLLLERERRRPLLLKLGLGLCGLFVILRAINMYGDPRPWTHQKTALFTVLSFIDCTKYPPSLLYLLMTIGPGIVFISLADRSMGKIAQPFITFGRVPLFYYLLHAPLIHLLAVAIAGSNYQVPLGSFLGTPHKEGYGYGLGVVYGLWILVVLLLYPACRWFADLKRRRRDAWLSYF